MPLSFLKKVLSNFIKKQSPLPVAQAAAPTARRQASEQAPDRQPQHAQRRQGPDKRDDRRPQRPQPWRQEERSPDRPTKTRTPAYRPTVKATGFYGLGIAPGMLEQIEILGFENPTPIQKETIPPCIEGKDMVGIAQTGTGKTLAFGIPMIQRLAGTEGKGLVLAPTRELALQIEEALFPFAQAMGMKTACLIGGASMGPQLNALRARPRLVIATPGRLIDHMEHGAVRLNDVAILVLDEADRMLDMGFAPQILRILKQVPKDRQTMLFSATMPPAITAIAGSFMRLPLRTEVAPSGTAPETVHQELYVVQRENKIPLLLKLLDKHTGSVLLFSHTKRGASRVASILRKRNYPATEIHADRTQAQRIDALEGFKSGKYRILVATDIAARGIDVTGIELVVNYDLPQDADNYVHRIGRTGRAGRPGHAISIAAPDQGGEVADIERLIKTSIEIASHPEIPSLELLKGNRRTLTDLLYGPPKGRKTGRERPITPLEDRPEHRRQWGR